MYLGQNNEYDSRDEFIQEFVVDYVEDLADRGITPDRFLAMPQAEQNALIIAMMAEEGEKPPAFITASPDAASLGREEEGGTDDIDGLGIVPHEDEGGGLF